MPSHASSNSCSTTASGPAARPPVDSIATGGLLGIGDTNHELRQHRAQGFGRRLRWSRRFARSSSSRHSSIELQRQSPQN